jgi:hypothetical protein
VVPSRLTPQSVALIVKAYAARLRLDPGTFEADAFRDHAGAGLL